MQINRLPFLIFGRFASSINVKGSFACYSSLVLYGER